MAPLKSHPSSLCVCFARRPSGRPARALGLGPAPRCAPCFASLPSFPSSRLLASRPPAPAGKEYSTTICMFLPPDSPLSPPPPAALAGPPAALPAIGSLCALVWQPCPLRTQGPPPPTFFTPAPPPPVLLTPQQAAALHLFFAQISFYFGWGPL